MRRRTVPRPRWKRYSAARRRGAGDPRAPVAGDRPAVRGSGRVAPSDELGRILVVLAAEPRARSASGLAPPPGEATPGSIAHAPPRGVIESDSVEPACVAHVRSASAGEELACWPRSAYSCGARERASRCLREGLGPNTPPRPRASWRASIQGARPRPRDRGCWAEPPSFSLLRGGAGARGSAYCPSKGGSVSMRR